MKKPLLLLTFLIMVLDFYGQGSKNFQISINVGPSMSNFVNRAQVYRITAENQFKPIKTSLTREALFGITASVGLEYYITNQLSINSGLAFEKKGISIHYDSVYNSSTSDYRSEVTYKNKITNYYFVIPLTLRKYFFKGNSLFVEAGLYGGILRISSLSMSDHIIRYHPNETPWYSYYSYKGTGIDDHTQKFDFGLTFGTGFKKSIGKKLWLTSGLKLNFGLCKIDALYDNERVFKPSGVDLNGGVSIKNYYGINSSARNLNMTLTVGLAYSLNNK